MVTPSGIQTWDISICLYLNLKHGDLDHSADFQFPRCFNIFYLVNSLKVFAIINDGILETSIAQVAARFSIDSHFDVSFFRTKVSANQKHISRSIHPLVIFTTALIRTL